MNTNPPDADDRVRLGVLRAELSHLKEFLTHRLDRLEAKMDGVCVKVEHLEGQIDGQATILQVHDERLMTLEKFRDNLLSTVVRWGSIGAGLAITGTLILAGVAKALGWW